MILKGKPPRTMLREYPGTVATVDKMGSHDIQRSQKVWLFFTEEGAASGEYFFDSRKQSKMTLSRFFTVSLLYVPN